MNTQKFLTFNDIIDACKRKGINDKAAHKIAVNTFNSSLVGFKHLSAPRLPERKIKFLIEYLDDNKNIMGVEKIFNRGSGELHQLSYSKKG